jgi:TolB-like protein/Flp pilus assembly protein TadD
LSANNKNVSFLDELKRRNVYRVGLAYVVLTWFLLQIIDTLGPILNLPDWAPKLVLTILGVGFPAVMLFAWAFELTPDGIKREKDVDRSQSITSNTGQRLDRITIGVLLIAVGMLLVDKFFISDTPAPVEVVVENSAPVAVSEAEEAPSIAVLPFVNMSDDKSSAYFSDGLADTVLHMLAQVREIRVAARTSSFQFRDQNMDIGEIGNQLNVGTVLEGSVQRAGDKIRITAQLIDVENGFHLWSGNYDRNLDDVFAIQDEIANEVVAALKVSLLGDVTGSMDSDQTENLDAYTEYLLGSSDLNMATSETLSSAVVHLQAAVRHDPEYARGWSTLGRAYLEMEGYGTMPRTDAVSAARDAAGRALDLAPNSSDALAILGWSETLDSNWEEGGQLLKRAVDYGPSNVVAAYYYAGWLAQDGRPDDAIAAYEKATRLDPLSELSYVGLANIYARLSRFEEAEATIAKLRAISPGSANASAFSSGIAMARGELAVAIREMKVAQKQDPGDPEPAAFVGRLYLAIDMPDEARRWMDRAVEIDAQHPMSRSAPLYLNYHAQQNMDENVRLARELLDDKIQNRNGSRAIALFVLLDHATKTEQFDALLETLDNLYPHLFDDPPHDFDKSTLGARATGMALMRSGETERGTELLEWWQSDQDKYDDIYAVERSSVNVRLALGDFDGALEKLDGFSQTKYFRVLDYMMLEHDSSYDPIREEPVFVAILDEYRENAKEQRLLLQAMNED